MGKNNEFIQYLLESKERVDYAVQQFEKHSREFDRKVSKILANL